MLITCPNCTTKFAVPDTMFDQGARKVRCTVCTHQWRHDPAAVAAVNLGSESVPLEAEPSAVPVEPDPEPVDFGETPLDSDAEAETSPAEDFDESIEVGAGMEADMSPGEPDQRRTVTEEELLDGDVDPIPDVFASGGPEDDEDGTSRPRKGLLAGVFIAVLLIVAAVAAFFLRADVVRAFPETLRFYEMAGIEVDVLAAGLHMQDPRVEIDLEDNRPVLKAFGKIVNQSDKERPVPNLALLLLNTQNQVVQSKVIAPPRPMIAPGEEMTFVIRLTFPSKAAEMSQVVFTEEAPTDG